MKVYVVTDGSYSEYHIEAIFTTEEQAEAYREWRWGGYEDDWRDDQVEEWELDHFEGDLSITLRRWHISLDSYDFGSVRISGEPYLENPSGFEPYVEEYRYSSISISVLAETKEEAIQKAKELCIEYKKDVPRIVEQIENS